MLRLNSKFLFIVFALLFSTNAFAEFFQVKNYLSEIYIQKNSIIDVKETIKVRFTSPRHGIFRYIPTKYRFVEKSGASSRVILNRLHIFNVKTPGFKHKIYRKNGYVVIRIGNPYRYVRNDVTYTISYSITGAVTFFKNHSRFYYNVIGTRWSTPIERASFEVILPGEKNFDEITYSVFSGYRGSQKKEKDVTFENGILECEINHPLKMHQGITLLMTFPEGFLKETPGFENTKLFVYENRVLFIPVFVFIALFTIWFLLGKDEKATIMTYYKPPEGVTSAEAGLLIDDKIDNRDLISLIFYWASKGFIKIEEVDNKTSFFKKRDLVLRKLKDLPDNAKDFELIIFTGLFPGSIKTVRISSLKNKFYQTMSEAKESLNSYVKYEDMYRKGTRALSKILMVTSLFIFGFAFEQMGKNTPLFVALLLSAVIVFVFGKIMPKKTKKGLSEYAAVKGFKEFMDRVEKNRLKELLDTDPEYFYNTLAYAVAFGEHKKWVSKFSDLVKEPPRWYSGSGVYVNDVFSNYAFASLINGSVDFFSETLGMFPSEGEVSGGFTGGGFSGGGAGGGGGGSW